MDRFESDRIGSNRIDATTLARPTHLFFLPLFSILMSSLLAFRIRLIRSIQLVAVVSAVTEAYQRRKKKYAIYHIIVLLYGTVY